VIGVFVAAAWAETDVSPPACDASSTNVFTVPANGAADVPVDVVFSAATNTELCDPSWSFRLTQGDQLVYEEVRFGEVAFGRPAADLLPDTPYTLEIRVDCAVKAITFTTGQGRAEPLPGAPALEDVTARWDLSSDEVELCATVAAVAETSSIAGYATTEPAGYWHAGRGGPMCIRWYDRSEPEQVCAEPVQWGLDGVRVTGDAVCADVEQVGRRCGARTEPVAALLLLLVWPRRRR
jgi:hypothetical protein